MRLPTISLTSLLFAAVFSPADAAPIRMTGSIKHASGYTVHLVAKDGTSRSSKVNAQGRFTLSRLNAKQLKGASLQLVDDVGHYAGPVVLMGNGARVATTFSGRLTASGSTIDLGKLALKNGYAKLAPDISAGAPTLFGKKNVIARRGKPLGAGELGLAAAHSAASRHVNAAVLDHSKAAVAPIAYEGSNGVSNPGADADRDGIPDSFDVDDDGDMILDGADPDASGSDIPYASMYLDFRRTINANVRDGLNATTIDAIIGGENMFSLATFISLSDTEGATVTGGHIVCANALLYCRPNSPQAWYGGVSESSSEFRNHAWSSLLTSSGYPRMEKISLNGGFSAIVAAIQPRVGASEFRPGDVYRAVLTGANGEVSSRTFTLAPYFASVPALKSYDAGSGETLVDYSSVSPSTGSIPGTSSSDPIVLTPSGTLTVTFWRPQRPAIRSDETGYYDWGHTNYGIVVDDKQATCAGYFTAVSADLVENPAALGTGNSPLFNQGADGMPLRDSSDDRAASASNTLTFTIDLKSCLQRAGGTATGVKSVVLSAAGENVTGGRSVAGQMFSVQF